MRRPLSLLGWSPQPKPFNEQAFPERLLRSWDAQVPGGANPVVERCPLQRIPARV